jgi:membrane dipeptidase
MLICDWHLDLSWNALEWNRDLTLPVAEIRRRERAACYQGPGRGTNTVSLPALREGNVAVVSATLLARHDSRGPVLTFLPKSGYESAEASYATAVGQLAYYRALEQRGLVRLLTDWPSLAGHVHQWQAYVDGGKAGDPPPLGCLLSMEGADPILVPDDLGEWWEAGLRILSLSHYGVSRYSHGTDTPGPLNGPAPALLRAMERLGVILDVTHLADEAMDQAFDLFGGVVLASHHNCRALVDRQRQLRDQDIRRIVERGGVIGAAMDNWMLDFGCDQTAGIDRRVATFEDVVDHIDHVCQVAGSARHAALGTDLDGGFGTEQSPTDLDTIADLQKLPALLDRRGYSADDIRGIMHGNWLDLMRRAWGGSSLPAGPAPRVAASVGPSNGDVPETVTGRSTLPHAANGSMKTRPAAKHGPVV